MYDGSVPTVDQFEKFQSFVDDINSKLQSNKTQMIFSFKSKQIYRGTVDPKEIVIRRKKNKLARKARRDNRH